MRCLSGSILRTFTSICWPTERTSAGIGDPAPGDVADVQQAVDAAEIDECAVVRQAANGALEDISFAYLGVALSPGRALFFLGEHAAVDDHIFFGTSSLIMRTRICCPTSFAISAASRAPLREAGMKARTPISTVRPPLTSAVTVPRMASFSAKACSSNDQSLGWEIFSKESS